MRSIANAGTLADVLTRPVYLVELGFAPAQYYSTGEQVSWNGETWLESSMRVDRIELDNLGRASVSLRVNNLDRVIGALVLGQEVRDRSAKIWVTYRSGSAGIVDPIQLVDGVMDGASVGNEVAIQVLSRAAFYGGVPRVRFAPPICNHMPPHGTILRWGTTEFRIERRG